MSCAWKNTRRHKRSKDHFLMNNHHSSGAVNAPSIIAAVSLAVLSIATSASAHDGHVYKGPTVPLGKGTAHTWVTVDKNHNPKAVYLNWNLHGHEPAHIWGSPHFDIHFYMIPPAEREAISDKDPAFMRKALHNPASHYVPSDYVLPREPDPIPGMGTHWADSATPEFHGKPFTHTLIYGSWDGYVTFIEPMVAKAVFDRREAIVAQIKQPAAVAISGRYPTRYRIEFDPVTAEHRIVLEDLVAREGESADKHQHASR
jgi:hypothetical protein